MTSTYAIIEGRIQKASEAISTRENSNQAEMAREFRVSYERLQSRLKNYQFKTAVRRELHNRALKPDQKSALQQYLIKTNELNLSVKLHLLQSTTNTLRAQNFFCWNLSLSSLSDNWIKWWLNQLCRLPDLADLAA